MPGARIAVVERDSTYKGSSTVLSVGSIRQQFSHGPNIEMSMFSAAFLRELPQHLALSSPEADPPDVQLVSSGYLFLASAKGVPVLRENHSVQRAHGAQVSLLTPAELQQRFPFLNTADIELASYGEANEGWFDPWSLLG